MRRFAPGERIVVREVWDGAPWLEHPVRVESDDAESGVLAVVLADGDAFTFPAHPRGVHPWAPQGAWHGPTALQLRRADDWYSVWRFHAPSGEFEGWYVNFERPVVRTRAGIDTDDLELDLVVDPDGTRHWKDVECLSDRLSEGRLDLDDLTHVLSAARDVWSMLDRDDRWWAPWDDWTPTSPSPSVEPESTAPVESPPEPS